MPIDFDAYENIKYEKSFVAFLDVLGFKELVFSKQKMDHKKLEHYFGLINSIINNFQEIEAKEPIGSIIISDSIILSMPHLAGGRSLIENFRSLCIAVGLIQQNLAKHNIWLRGAISSGDTYFDSKRNQIVGPAYANAYKLEEEYAKNPRVILDGKLINELGFLTATEFINSINNKANGGLDYMNWKSNILFYWYPAYYQWACYIEHDLPLFIDYLSPNVNMNKEDLILITGYIKSNIYKDLSVYSKYRWVVEYLKTAYLNNNHLLNINEIEQILTNI
jgi:hypothetical protein